jgi:phosphoglycerate kinase
MRERGARIVIACHFGRPKGERKEKYSLRPVRDRFAELTGWTTHFADDCIGEEAEQKAAALEPGEILMLENLRFHAGEEANDPEFSRQLARLGDVYVNDAFGACHRAHASIVGVAELFPRERRAAGLLLSRELDFLQKVTQASERPFVAVLGGAKIAGKIEPLEALVELADSVLIGGGMANTFLAASGISMGSSLVDKDSIEVAERILAGNKRAEIVLPDDLVVADSLDAPTFVGTRDVAAGVQPGAMALDIGLRTVMKYSEILAGAKMIFWNGPMGVFEHDEFAEGTRSIAKAVAGADALSVVGGGESVDAVKQSGYADRISHISTGGGASLEFISGAKLPGIEVLRG